MHTYLTDKVKIMAGKCLDSCLLFLFQYTKWKCHETQICFTTSEKIGDR